MRAAALSSVLTILGTAATTASADLTCTLQRELCGTDCPVMPVHFAIDPAQFSAPVSADDPPRRQVTTVTLDDKVFVAEAILFPGGVSGFHEDAGDLGSRLMIVQPDGTARLSLLPQGEVWVGGCSGS